MCGLMRIHSINSLKRTTVDCELLPSTTPATSTSWQALYYFYISSYPITDVGPIPRSWLLSIAMHQVASRSLITPFSSLSYTYSQAIRLSGYLRTAFVTRLNLVSRTAILLVGAYFRARLIAVCCVFNPLSFNSWSAP